MYKPYFMIQMQRGTQPSWVECPTQQQCMMVTISPDPLRNRYGMLSPDNQIEYIKIAIYKMLFKYDHVKYHSGIFELNKSGDIHYHGVLTVHVKYNACYHAIQIGKYINNLIGRIKNRYWWICCMISNNDDLDKWLKYLDKDVIASYNGKCPASMVERHKITDYLIISD